MEAREPAEPDPSWTVLKFGGSSVADPDNWPTIEGAVRAVLDRGERPLLVCSAIGGVSDDLEKLLAALDTGRTADAEEIVQRIEERHDHLAEALGVDVEKTLEPSRRELQELLLAAHHLPRLPAALRAQIMALGELMSTRLGAAWLRGRGLATSWYDARDLLVSKPPLPGASAHQQYLSATCPYAPDAALQERLARDDGEVLVTQGFIARNAEGFTVLLGRGGSDTAATTFGAKLEAARVEIWSDVPGLFSANPHRIPVARLLQRATYEEAETLAALGARVLHTSCLEPVRVGGIPLDLRWTQHPEVEGTRISGATPDMEAGLRGISSRHRLCLITVERSRRAPVGFLANVADCFKRQALSMELVSSSATRIRTVIDLQRAPGVADRIPDLSRLLEQYGRVRIDRDVASVSLVGSDLRGSLPRIAGWVAQLGEEELLMIDQAANDLSFTMLVRGDRADGILERLHRDLIEEAADLTGHFGPTWEELTDSSRRSQLQATS